MLTEDLKRIIGAAPMSRYRLAKKARVSKTSISRFMSGERGLSLPAIDRIGEVLGLRIVQGDQGGLSEAEASLACEVDRLLAAPKAQRSKRLAEAAATLGRLVKEGALSESQVEQRLLGVALETGLSLTEATAAIREGLESTEK